MVMSGRLLVALLAGLGALRQSFSFFVPPACTADVRRSLSSRLNANRAFERCVSRNPDALDSLNELFAGLQNPLPRNEKEQGLAFLFVGRYHAVSFDEIVCEAAKKLGKQSKLLALVGNGIVGGGNEIDDPSIPGISLLCGKLPPNSRVETFGLTPRECLDSFDSSLKKKVATELLSQENEQNRPPSYVVFADPFSPIDKLLQSLDSIDRGAIVAGGIGGGISVPTVMGHRQPTLAMDGAVMPPGSIIGVALSGNIGLQTIVARGCYSVGPTFNVTSSAGNVLLELDSKPAVEQLEKVAETADKDVQELIRNGLVLGGISKNSQKRHDAGTNTKQRPSDGKFLLRQIVGFQPRRKAIVMGEKKLREGDTFRFHVRAADVARVDMKLMIQQAKTERLFLGPSRAGSLLAAIQVSCAERGVSLFGAPNEDLQRVQELFESDGDEQECSSSAKPISGFFANREIGPMATRIGRSDVASSREATDFFCSHMHSFTTVIAMLCDYSEKPSSELELSTDNIALYENDAWG